MDGEEKEKERDASIWQSIQWMLLMVAIVVGHFALGGSQDHSAAKVGLFIAILTGAIAVCTLIAMLIFKGVIPKRKDLIELAIALTFVASLGYGVAYFISQFYLATIRSSAVQIPTSALAIGFTSVAALSIGIALFAVRVRHRFVYGLSEIIVGFCAAGYKIYSEGGYEIVQAGPVAFAVLTGAIYLIVRGLDNMHQGIDKDPIGKRVSKWFDSVTEDSGESKPKDKDLIP